MKRVISFLLSIVMVISMLPVSAFATEVQPEETIPAVEETVPVTEAVVEETTAAEAEETTAPETESTVPQETTPAEPTIPEKTVQTVKTEPAEKREVVSVEKIISIDADNEDNELALQLYLEDLFYDNRPAVFGTAAREELTDAQQKLYDFLKAKIVKVAAGELASTTFTVTDSTLASWGVERTGSTVDEAADKLFMQLAIDTVVSALLHDCPYELYWFNKVYNEQTDTGGALSTMRFQYLDNGNLKVSELGLLFRVVKDMQGAGYSEDAPVVDTSMAASAVAAADNAKSIAAEYRNASAYDKLVGFRNEICDLVSYNDAAASAGTFSLDADPWQLIWVFDGNPSTKVVCEGYSKAFQYLCDEAGGIDCYTVTGSMGGGTGAGLHMWNIVTLDGKNYLVDITNSDDGTAGFDGSLFLAGTEGSAATGYTFDTAGGDIWFTYDNQTLNLWGKSGILELADSGYEPPVVTEPEAVLAGTCGENLTWTLVDGVLTISGTGEMDDFGDPEETPWYESEIREVILESGVSSIGRFAFSGTAISSAEISDTVTNIGVSAFSSCANLKNITIPSSVQTIGNNAFWCCENLSEVIISDGVVSIGEYAFEECHALKNITIPDSVEQIGKGAFAYCGLLEEVYIGKNVGVIGVMAFGCTNLSLSRVEIAEENRSYLTENNCVLSSDRKTLVFYWDSENRSYVIPDGVETIADYAFYGSWLNDIEIPDTVKVIGKWAFGCTDISSIVIPQYVTRIEDEAFFDCGGLSEIYFEGDAPVFGESAFNSVTATAFYPENNPTWTANVMQNYGGELTWGDGSLKAPEGFVSGTCGDDLTWTLNKGVLTISGSGPMDDFGFWDNEAPWHEYAYHKIILENGITYIGLAAFHDAGASEVEIPDSVTVIGEHAFAGSELVNVEIPNSVTEIGYSAFDGCGKLTYVTIPDSVRRIGSGAFSFCSSLREVEIPDSITQIEEGTFALCSSLEKVIIGKNVSVIGDYAFNGDRGDPDSSSVIMYFTGNAPEIGSEAFDGKTATIYYPEDNATWTSAVMQNYGGSITWEAVGEEDNAISQAEFLQLVNQYAGTDEMLMLDKQVELTSDLVLDQNVSIMIWRGGSLTANAGLTIGENTHIVVGVNGTMTVNGSLTTQNNLAIQVIDGVLNFPEYPIAIDLAYPILLLLNDNAKINNLAKGLINVNAYIYTAEELAARIADSTGYNEAIVTVSADMELVQDITVPENMTLVISEDYDLGPACLTVPNGRTLTNDGHVTIGDGCTLLVEAGGTLVNNEEDTVAVFGTYTNNGTQINHGFIDYYNGQEPDDGLFDVNVGAKFFENGSLQSTLVLNSITFEPGYNVAEWLAERESMYLSAFTEILGHENWSWDPAGVYYDENGNQLTADDLILNRDLNIYMHVDVFAAEGPSEPETTTLTFMNSLAGNMVAINVTDGEQFATLPAAGNVKGYDFVGWYSEENGQGQQLSDGDTWYAGMPTTWYAFYEKSEDDEKCTLTIYAQIFNEGLKDRVVMLMSQDFTAGDNMMTWLNSNEDQICQEIDSVISGCYTDATWSWNPRNYCDISGEVLTAEDLIADGNKVVYITVDLEEDEPQLPSNACGDNLTWTFDEATDTLTISGTGEMYGYINEMTPWHGHDLDTRIKKVVIAEGVTSIGHGAFAMCSALEEIIIASTVTSIGDTAFEKCGALKKIVFAGDMPTFGNRAFMGVRATAFYWMSNSSWYPLPEEQVAAGVIQWIPYSDNSGSCGDNLYWCYDPAWASGNLWIEGSGEMYDYAEGEAPWFENDLYKEIDYLNIGKQVSSIGKNAFAGFDTMEFVVFNEGIAAIGENAFKNCTALIMIGFLGDAPIIAANAFRNVTTVAEYPGINKTWTAAMLQNYGGNLTWNAAFDVIDSGNCGSGVTYELHRGGILIISGTGAMDNYTAANPAPWSDDVDEIKELIIEDGVTTIGDNAFCNCEMLKDVSIPASIEAVGDNAFHMYHLIWFHIDQTVRQWSKVTIGADNDWFPGWDTTDFVEEAPIVASGIFGAKVFWELNEDGTLEAFGSGDMYAFGATGSYLYDLPVKKVVIGEGITSIGECAFEVAPGVVLEQTLETVTVASTVREVGIGAFRGLTALNSVTFTGDAPAFGEVSFADVTATIYYPADNATWTADIMQNYGGNLTWEAMGPVMDQEAFDALLNQNPYIHEEVILDEDVIILQDELVVIEGDGKLVVPSGVTLTVSSELYVWGDLYVEEGGALVMDNPGDESNWDDDNWLYLYVNSSVTIDGTLTVGPVCSFMTCNGNEEADVIFGETSVVTNYGAVVAENGGSIIGNGTINNYQNVFSYGDLVLNGTLNNDGFVYVGRPNVVGILEVNGILLNSGEIEVRENGVLKVHGNVSNLENGWIGTDETGVVHVKGGTLDVTAGRTAIDGLELILCEGSEIKGLDMGTVDAIGYPESYEQLAEMLGGNVYKSLLLLPECDIMLENSIVIYENTQLILRDVGITLTVPDGRSLVNNGRIVIEGSSILWLENGSIFGGNMPEMESSDNFVDQRDRASHDWFVNQLKTVQNGFLEIHEDVTLAEDLVIPASVGEIVFRGGKLIIPSSVTLTTYSRMGFMGGLYIAEGGEFVLANDGTNVNVNEWGWLLSWIENNDDNEINGTVTIAENTSLCTHSTVNVGASGRVVNNGTVSLERGTWNVYGSFENYNNLPVNPEATLYVHDSGTLTIGSDYSGGSMDIYGRVDVYGTVNNYDWIFVGNAWNEFAAELYIDGEGVLNNIYGVEYYGAVEVHAGSKLMVDGTVNNDGDIAAFTTGRIEVFGELINNNMVRLDNFGNGIFATMDINGTLTNNAELYVVPGAALNIHYDGTLNNTAAAEAYLWTETNVDGTVQSSGYVEVAEDANVQVNGKWTNEENGVLSIVNGTVTVSSDDMTNNGKLVIEEKGVLKISGIVNQNRDAENHGEILVGFNDSGILEQNGTMLNDGRIIINPEGTMGVNEGATLDNAYVSKKAGGVLDVRGLLWVHGVLNNAYLMSVGNPDGYSMINISEIGTVNNLSSDKKNGYGNMVIGAGADVQMYGTLNNDGVLTNESDEFKMEAGSEMTIGKDGKLINNASVYVNESALIVDGTFTNNGNAAYEYEGLWVRSASEFTVNGTMTNNAPVHIGDWDSAVMNLNGTVTNNASVQIDTDAVLNIAEDGAWNNASKAEACLYVYGNAYVEGVLNNSGNVVLDNPYGATGVMTIRSTGTLYNKYINAELANMRITENGKLILEGTVKNDSLLNNAGIVAASGTGKIVSGSKAEFVNTGSFVAGDTEEPMAVAINREEAFEMTGGDSVILEAEILPGNVTNTKIEWSVSDPALMTLKVKGNTVTLKAADVSEIQTVTLTAKAADGLALPDEIEITIRPEVKSIDIEAENYNTVLIQNWETQNPIQLTAVVAPVGAASNVTWTSSNEDVAKVSDTGLVTFTGETGTATITATATDGSGVKASVTYKVIAPVDIHAHDGKTSIDLMAGKSATLKVLDENNKAVKHVDWSFVEKVEPDVWQDDHTDYSAYVTLSSSGKLTAKKVSEQITVYVRAMAMVEGRPVDAEIYTVTIYPTVNYVDILWNGAVVNGKNIYLDLAEGTELTLTGQLHPTDAKDGIDWTSSNEKIATVENGVVKPVRDDDGNYRTGTVTITATAQDGSKKKATVKVEIGALTKVVNVQSPAATLDSGKNMTLTYDTGNVKPTISGVTWAIIEGAEYAKIDAKGKLTAKTVIAPQKVVIVATSRDAAKIESAPVTITILPKAEENLNLLIGTDNVTKTTVNAEIGDTITISAMKFFNTLVDAEKWSVDWTVKGENVTLSQTTGDSTVVTVNETGKATITATGKNTDGKKVTATVTINVGVLSDGVKILSDVTTVGSGKSITLKAEAYADGKTVSNKKVVWSLAEGDEAWAKISSSGKLTATKDLTSRKTVTVWVEAQDGASAPTPIQVTITPLAQNVQIFMWENSDFGDNMTGTTLEWPGLEGWELNLSAKVYPFSEGTEDLMAYQEVEWKSSNTKIAAVDTNGHVTFGEKTGTVTITATAQDGSGKKATFKLKTFIPVQDLEIADATVVGGKTLKLSSLTKFITPNATNKKLSYTIVDGNGEAFAEVTSNGQLKTKKVTGLKWVKIQAYNDYSLTMAEFVVFIRPQTSAVTLSQTNGVKLTVGDTMTISATSLPEYPLDMEYEIAERYAELYTWKVTNAKDGGIVMEDGSLTGSTAASEITIRGVKPGKTLTVTATAMDGSGKKATVKIAIVAAE